MRATASKVGPRRGGCLLALLLGAGPAVAAGAADDRLPLTPGTSLERRIAGAQSHVYLVPGRERPLLFEVEQLGIDLVLEVAGPEGGSTSDTPGLRWGPETVLLAAAGEVRVEVHPKEPGAFGGRYRLRLEALSEGESLPALTALCRAGRKSDRREARAALEEALARFRERGELRREAQCLTALGSLAAQERELKAALASYGEAAGLWRELGERALEAAARNELGLTRLYTGELDSAREALSTALARWEELGEEWDAIQTGGNLCFLDATAGALPAALACYQDKLERFERLGDRSQEGRLLGLLAGVYDLLGEPDQALEHYGRALERARATADLAAEARGLNNLAVVHRALGEWQEALRFYGQAREVLTRLGDRKELGALLSNLGFTYHDLGQPERALPLLDEALELRREVGDRRGEAITLNHRGSARLRLGELGLAREDLLRALALAPELGNPRQEAQTRLLLAEVRLAEGDAPRALAELAPALTPLGTMGLGRSEARALVLQGRALAAAGRLDEARQVLARAVARCRELRLKAEEADALQALATSERGLGLTTPAHTHAAEAIAAIEALQKGFVSPDLRAAFLATERRAYALAIELEMAAGRGEAALELAERARARSLTDALFAGLRRGAEGAPPALAARREALRHRASALADQQLKTSGAKAGGLAKSLEGVLVELDGVEAELRHADARYASVAQPRVLGAAEIRSLLDPGTLLLEYALGPAQSTLWAVTPGEIGSFTLPPGAEIESAIREVTAELSTLEAGSAPRREGAAALARTLLGPAWPQVLGARRLIVVPDGALHLLPFAALPTPETGLPLLESHEISYLPSATTLALLRERLARRPAAPLWAMVFADPVFRRDDPRLEGRGPRGGKLGSAFADLDRLPASRREAEAIAALAPGAVQTALGFAAQREAVLSPGLPGARVLHFATHALADSRAPELSGLVLSLYDEQGSEREGLLSLPEIYDLELGADLAVLSGCRTALGKEVAGEGVVGLARAFFFAGVPRVVASLWRVEDRTTAELMRRFYQALWREGLPPAAALAAAQRSLARDPRYRDPYSWAAFVFQGDWRAERE